MTRKSHDSSALRREIESGIKRVLAEIAGEATPPELRKLAEDLEIQLARGSDPKLNGAVDHALQNGRFADRPV